MIQYPSSSSCSLVVPHIASGPLVQYPLIIFLVARPLPTPLPYSTDYILNDRPTRQLPRNALQDQYTYDIQVVFWYSSLRALLGCCLSGGSLSVIFIAFVLEARAFWTPLPKVWMSYMSTTRNMPQRRWVSPAHPKE